MSTRLFCLFLAMSIPAAAQSADALYQRACGPKAAEFTVEHVKQQAPTAPEPGKALVFIVQKGSRGVFTTRIGLDGAWAGVVDRDSYVPLSVTPGEHHLCVATQDKKHPEVELLHINAEAGKTYYYIVRGLGVDDYLTMILSPVDRDLGLYLIASDTQTVAKPKL